MRTAFIRQLVIEARANPAVFLVVGDLGYSVVEEFAREFPDRFLNAGVAEQNMTGVAAGLASEGYQVFTYSIANFPTFRCAEQIRNDVAYHKLPVTVVSVGGGVAYGNLGYSHHAVQDIALMRSMPGMMLACPGDPAEVRGCLRYLVQHPQPSYLRIGKAGEPAVHAGEVSAQPGVVVPTMSRLGARRAILTTGGVLKLATDVAQSRLPEWDVASLPLWSATDAATGLRSWVENYERVLVMEDHLVTGGFGSFVLECLRDRPELLPRVRSIGLRPEVCGLVASQAALHQAGGLSVDEVLVSAG